MILNEMIHGMKIAGDCQQDPVNLEIHTASEDGTELVCNTGCPLLFFFGHLEVTSWCMSSVRDNTLEVWLKYDYPHLRYEVTLSEMMRDKKE